MLSYFEIEGSPAIPLDRICKVDPVFIDQSKNKCGFSVHLGDGEKRCAFYFTSEEEAEEGRKLLLSRMDAWNRFKYEESCDD